MGRGKELGVLGALGEVVAHEWSVLRAAAPCLLAGGLPEKSGTYVRGRACIRTAPGAAAHPGEVAAGLSEPERGYAQLALALCPAPLLAAVGARASHRLLRPGRAPSLLCRASASQSDLYVCHSDRMAINLIKGFAKINKSLLAVPRLVFCVPAIWVCAL